MVEPGSGELQIILTGVEAIQMIVMTTMAVDVRQKTSSVQQVPVFLRLPTSILTLLVPIPVVQLITVLKPEPTRITIAMPVPVLPIQILALRIVLPIQFVQLGSVLLVLAGQKIVLMTIVLATPYMTILQAAISIAAEGVVLIVPAKILLLLAVLPIAPCSQTPV